MRTLTPEPAIGHMCRRFKACGAYRNPAGLWQRVDRFLRRYPVACAPPRVPPLPARESDRPTVWLSRNPRAAWRSWPAWVDRRPGAAVRRRALGAIADSHSERFAATRVSRARECIPDRLA